MSSTFKQLLVDDTIAPLRQDIEELKDVQENRLLPSVTEIEITVKSYADSYKIIYYGVGGQTYFVPK